ncbi:Epoxide hydrolase [Serinicoccus hydrothermalis]|uniref:Epoxide hydrolase n=1 Tax=Serinicoccus hydrothermalis TaxID=1758689 RepID=A0A1B1N9U9_9MICO|nr:alpha/beta fold hydrolase [Serinicoccus hydrothermalis]ANS78155.1 Epoxide hydrolase [Serinicoccus hydrothermalis]
MDSNGGRVAHLTHDGLRFEAVLGGDPAGEPVVLLHGFPQDASAWDGVAGLLHQEGLRTLAPHQRGYLPGAAPTQVSAYRLEALVGDVLAWLDDQDLARAHVVGHDWGGAVAWALAAWHPERVSTLTVLSTSHPAALAWAVRHGDQARRSWYIAGFQVPRLPELALARMLRRGGLARTGLPAADGKRYAARLPDAASLRGPVNWYRAAAARGGRRVGAVGVPTAYLWGARDPFLGRAAAERTEAHVSGDYRFVELQAGHWLLETRADEVAAAVLGAVRGRGHRGH